MPRPTLLPILDENLDEFAGFLEANMGGRTAAEWRKAFQQNWCETKPNNGFMLRDQTQIVGAIGAIYATRVIRGKPEHFCNITSWYVKPEFRSQSLRLATTLTSQPGYHFTDFTATKVVADSLRFLKFTPLNAKQILIPNLLRLGFSFGHKRVFDDPSAMQGQLDTNQARVMGDHANLPWLRQAVIADDRGPVHIVYKPVAYKRTPCAFVLAVNDRAGFTRNLGRFSQYLLFRHRILSIRIERRFLTRSPLFAITLKRFPRKLYRSPSLDEHDIDNLYSEVAALDMRTSFM